MLIYTSTENTSLPLTITFGVGNISFSEGKQVHLCGVLQTIL